MTDPTAPLREHRPSHEFLVCIDSDGCAFDTMEIKQKECFIPVHCREWGLQPVAKFARMAGEFVNLYSQWRGINRFPAMLMIFDLLDDWDEVQKRGFKSPEVPNLRRWVDTESKLGNPALKAYCATHSEADEPDMHRALRWSVAVNEAVEDIVRDVPPFPFVRESLEKAKDLADILVCSATPHDALLREWQEHGIDGYPFTIAGQEQGKKSEHIEMCAKGKYDPAKVLMIGDAPGDMKAARANNALFFPILPGSEEVSWQRFHDEALDRFVAGTYAGAYEEELIREFNACLPDTPPWKKK
jgi:phosphoglycolate phosphatase-like HAD superfamily hydrolase